MHFTVTPLGSAGDVHPFLGLALALRERGHDVLFATNGYFAEAARRHDLPFHELGSADEFLAALDNPDLWSQTRSFRHVFERIAAVFRAHYGLIETTLAQRDTVVISSCLGFGARIAQEKLGVHHVCVHLQPGVIHSHQRPPLLTGYPLPRWFTNAALRLGERLVLDRVAGPELNAFRAELGLPPMKRLLQWWHSVHHNVCLFPSWFAPPQSDWPPYTQTSFPLWDQDAHEGLAADVEAFLAVGSPPLVFTPGSANVFGRDFFACAAEVCQRLGRRGILLSRFTDHIPQALPEDVRHFEYVPLRPLLPRCAALIHHGGVGTTAQGFLAGVPQLIMALAHDQFDNGARVKQHGVGEWVYPVQFRPRKVARVLARLLDSVAVRAACEHTAQALQSEQGLDDAAQAIETRALAHTPPG